MRFTFIAAKKAEHTVTILCRCLCVTRSGFYAWQARPESLHARDDRRLKVLVHTSFAESRRNYGSPRVHDDLIDWQERVSRKRVVRLMQEEGLKARVRKRYTHTTMSDHDQPVAANLLDRRFEAAAAESTLGRGYDRVRHRHQRQALSGGDPRSVFPVRRRLGAQCRQ